MYWSQKEHARIFGPFYKWNNEKVEYQAFLLSYGLPPPPHASYTYKKENQIVLIYKEIQSGAVAKSYMRKGFLIYEKMRKYFTIYEKAVTYKQHGFATAPF